MIFFVILSVGWLDITHELQFHENGSLDYAEYRTVHKNALTDNLIQKMYEDPDRFLNPLAGSAFFFEDWGGDTYEIWKKQMEGQDLYLEGIASDKNLFFAGILNEFSAKKNNIQQIGYQYERFVKQDFLGYKTSISFEDFENAKIFFADPINTKILNEFIEEVEIKNDFPVDMIKSISRNGKEIKMDFIEFQEDANNLKKIIELSNDYLELPKKEEFEAVSLSIRVKLPYPAQAQNASLVLDNGKTLVWNLAVNDRAQFTMFPNEIYKTQGSGILGTVLLLGFLCIITIGIILYIDTKKNPEYGIVAQYKKRKWMF